MKNDPVLFSSNYCHCEGAGYAEVSSAPILNLKKNLYYPFCHMTPLALPKEKSKSVFSDISQLSPLISDIYGYQSLNFIHEKIITIQILSTTSLILIA